MMVVYTFVLPRIRNDYHRSRPHCPWHTWLSGYGNRRTGYGNRPHCPWTPAMSCRTGGRCRYVGKLGKLVTEKPVDFVGFDNVVEFNKTRQNDDSVIKAYKGLFSWNSLQKKPVNWLKLNAYIICFKNMCFKLMCFKLICFIRMCFIRIIA